MAYLSFAIPTSLPLTSSSPSVFIGPRVRPLLFGPRQKLRRRPRFHSPPSCAQATAASPSTPAEPAVPSLATPTTIKPRALNLSAPSGSAIPLSPQQASSTLAELFRHVHKASQTDPFLVPRLITSFILILLSKLLLLAVPVFYKRIIDTLATVAPRTFALGPSLFSSLPALFTLYYLSRTVASILHELRTTIFARAGQRLGRRITRDAFHIIHGLGSKWYAGIATGTVARVVDRGTRSIIVIFRALILAFVPSVFELGLVVALMLWRRWYGAVGVVLAMFFGYLLWTFRITERLARTRLLMNNVDNEASAKLADSIINYEAVATFGNRNFEVARYDACLAAYEEVSVRNEWLFGLLNAGQNAVFTSGLTAILFMLAAAVRTGAKTVGDIAMITTMLQQLWSPLSMLGWQYRELKQSLVDLQNLFDLVQTKPTVEELPGAPDLVVTGGEIIFDNVTFSYPLVDDRPSIFAKEPANIDKRAPNPRAEATAAAAVDGNGSNGRTVIRNLSFRVPPGKTFALVGESGSGKSTVLRLLYRLYDVDSGRISIDGQNVAEVTLTSLRDSIAMVPQDTILFNDTVAYNIGYGRPGASGDEVVAAAKAASIHEAVMAMPRGYDTLCGERGVRLSGGERQRLSAARAYLKNSRIVLQDEATSALDSKTEAEVTKALKSLGKNRTTLVVAHRLSTIFDADWIIVMRKGLVVEQGTHKSLLKIRDGVYKGMWERQQDKKILEAEESDSRVCVPRTNGYEMYDRAALCDADGRDGEADERSRKCM